MQPFHTQPAPLAEDCQVVELRQYTLKPHRRNTLIELFEREFLESQEAVGMRVIGQFRDLGDADRFVWLRGFADMDSRRRALETFYFGPVWASHRDTANATMVDSDNVLLLRPAWPGAGVGSLRERAPLGATTPAPGAVDISVFHLAEPAGPVLLAFARQQMSDVLMAAGARQIAWYVTHAAENTFPRLPVREGEHVLVGVALFDDVAALAGLADSGAWQRDIAPTLAQWLIQPTQALTLAPTPRSALRAG